MQKDLKGGYQLISLGMTPIEDILHIDVELLKTTKRIVLTGISIDGKAQLPDKTVDIEYDNGDIIFKNVYGYDLTIDSVNGDVGVSETSTGSTLFEHTITFLTPGEATRILKIINNDSTPITLNLNSVYSEILSALKYNIYNEDEETLLGSSNNSYVVLGSGRISFFELSGVASITIGDDDYSVASSDLITAIDSFTGSDTVTKY